MYRLTRRRLGNRSSSDARCWSGATRRRLTTDPGHWLMFSGHVGVAGPGRRGLEGRSHGNGLTLPIICLRCLEVLVYLFVCLSDICSMVKCFSEYFSPFKI